MTVSLPIGAVHVRRRDGCPHHFPHGAVAAGRLGSVLEAVFTTILVATTIGAGAVALLVVLKLFKGQA